MSDDVERLFLRSRSEYSLPAGILPDPDGLAKALELAARATPLETFKSTAELVLGVLKKSTNECLRNGYIQAMSCNDVQTAHTCLNILQNKNSSCAGSISQTEYPSCASTSSFDAANKNVSSLSDKSTRNPKYRLDASVSFVRADSNSNFNNPLTVIVEREEEKARNSNVLAQAADRAETAELASQPKSAEKTERGKKHKFSYPSKETRNVVEASSDSEQEVSPKRRVNSRPGMSARNGEDKSVKLNQVESRTAPGGRLHRRSESEDSEELFRPSQSKKPSPQNNKRRGEPDYQPADSRRDKSKNRDSSDAYSPQRHLPRKPCQPRNRTYRRQYTSDSEDDYNKSKFNRVSENKKRAYSKKTDKQCYSDSDIPSPAKTKVRPSKSKRCDTTDSESEIDRKRSVKNKSADVRERIRLDADVREPSYRRDAKPRRSRSAATKSSKRSRSYSSETSLSPSPLKCKPTNKTKRGKTKQQAFSDSEVNLDSSSRRKPVRRNKKTVKDLEPRSAKSQSKVTEKADKKDLKKPVSKKGQNNVGKLDVKSTASKRKKSVESKGEEEENLPSTSKDVSRPYSSNTLKFMSKLKELETSVLNGTPDPLATKKTKNSKKSPAPATKKKSPASANRKKSPASTNKKKSPASASKKVPVSNKNKQGSEKQSKTLNKKTPTKSPVTEVKKKPSASKANKKTTYKPSAAKSRATKTQKPGAEKNPRKKPVATKSKPASENKATVKERPKDVKSKGKKTPAGSQSKETVEKETESKNEEHSEADKNVNSLMSSDESFKSDSELEAPLGSLSTCLNSIKRQMPRQVGTATPPLRIFLSTNSDILSDASETSSFDRVPIKLDDKNIVKRMAKANRPKQPEQDRPTTSKPPNKLPETPETLRKMMKINKKFEEKQDSDVECSSFSDN